MSRLTVHVPLLNVRNEIPSSIADKTTITGKVQQGYTFNATVVPLAEVEHLNMGNWYEDENNGYYWGGGLVENNDNPVAAVDGASATAANNQWWYQLLHIDKLKQQTSVIVTVAILDTGLANIPNQASPYVKIAGKYNFLYGADANDVSDMQSGHGTLCASLIAGKTSLFEGILPDSRLFIGKTHGDDETTNASLLAAGINYVLDPQNNINADIISISGGVGYDDNLEKLAMAVTRALTSNVVVVAAIGNLVQTTNGLSPALFPDCISIGAINEQGGFAYDLNPSTTRIDFLFPGKNVLGINVLDCAQLPDGTSQACALATGVIALVLSRVRQHGLNWKRTDLLDFLKRSSKTIVGRVSDSPYPFYKIDGDLLLTNFNQL